MCNFLKLTALILTLCMVLAVPVSAAESGSCGENLRWSFDNGTLTISGTDAMANYDTPEDRPWHHLAEQVTAIVLDEGVTTVGSFAFAYMPNVEILTLPSTLEQIGLFAFISCEKLTQLDLPQGLQSIGQQAFFLCTGLNEVRIPGSVTFPWGFNDFSDFALNNCTELKTLTFKGDAPYFCDTALWGNDLTIRYPEGNATWTEEVMVNYGANSIIWESYKPENPFRDVPAKSFYEEPVAWAVAQGITNGISATEFGPLVNCNRAQVVTFLYRSFAE